MTTQEEKRPEIFVELAATSRYGSNDQKMAVGKLNIHKHPAYIQFLDSDGPCPKYYAKHCPRGSFNITSFQMKNDLTLIKKIENVSTVTVHLDEKENVLLFEILSYKGDNPIFRYFARTKFGNENEKRWVEYLYKKNEMLDEKQIETILKKCKEYDFLNKTKLGESFLNTVRIYSNKFIPRKYESEKEERLYHNDYFPYVYPEAKIPDNLKMKYGIPYYDEEKPIQIIHETARNGQTGHQTKENGRGKTEEQEKKDKGFLETNVGMSTVIASGSVGGAALGGSLIYLVTNFR